MIPFRILIPLVTALALVSPAEAGIVFGPVKGKPGQSVKLVTRSETPGGTVLQSVAGRNTNGTISISRDRELVWTFRQPGADGTLRGMVRVPEIKTVTALKIDGKEEKSTDLSPLTGKMFSMSKAPKGDWKFELDGSVPLSRVRQEIEELTVYLKRDWYPKREVNLGDSWEFDPTWVKHIIEKDLHRAKSIGTMRLRQIRRSLTGQYAVIDVSILSTGADYRADGSEVSASVELIGEAIVNLDTMLDEKLELKGKVVSTSRGRGESKTVTLPVKLSAKKSFVRDSAFP